MSTNIFPFNIFLWILHIFLIPTFNEPPSDCCWCDLNILSKHAPFQSQHDQHCSLQQHTTLHARTHLFKPINLIHSVIEFQPYRLLPWVQSPFSSKISINNVVICISRCSIQSRSIELINSIKLKITLCCWDLRQMLSILLD